jgi:spermidine/putrescine transport system substrate-binding protein
MVTPPARGGRSGNRHERCHADDSKTLYFYNWTEYVPPGLLEQFTKETGIKVIYSTYESNETMYAKLKTYKDGAYDLVVPSTYFVDKMRKEGMLQKIDKSKLTNFSNLDPQMLNKPFDPNNDYSIPYIWGRRLSASTATLSIRKPSPAGPTCGNRNTKAACC